jgi:ubiquinone/menaquinone biosynthesis C-methylase UbiE
MGESWWDTPGVAKEIDTYWHTSGEIEIKKAMANTLSKVMVPGSVLEVGCGSGLVYGALRYAGLMENRKYVGGDSSNEMLKIARSRFPEVKFKKMDILDLGKVHADNVLCVHVLQHLVDYKPAVSELLRVTGKVLYIASWFADKDVAVINSKTGVPDNFIGRNTLVDYIHSIEPSANITWFFSVNAICVRL